MTVKISKLDDLSPLTDSVLTEMEAKANISVPRELREYLLLANGFHASPNYIPSPIGDYYVEIPFIAGLDENGFMPNESADTRSVSYLSWVYGDCIPSSCIPIGYVGEANLLIVWHRGSRKGKVGFKKYDEDRLEEPGYSSKDLKVLAKDFKDFINLFSEDLTEY